MIGKMEAKINVKDFVKAIPSAVLQPFRRRILDYVRDRKFRAKMKRRSFVSNDSTLSNAVAEVTDAPILKTVSEVFGDLSLEDLPREGLTEGDALKAITAFTDGEGGGGLDEVGGGAAANDIDPSGGMSAPDEEGSEGTMKFDEAAKLIQRVVKRSFSARRAATKNKIKTERRRTQAAFSSDGFFSVVEDILANTMFNLLQEASYGEFN
eukprot:gene26941-34801_t